MNIKQHINIENLLLVALGTIILSYGITDARVNYGQSSALGVDVVRSTHIKNGEIVNADLSSSAAISFSKMASIPTGSFLAGIGDVLTVVTDETMAQLLTKNARRGNNSDITQLSGLTTRITAAQGGTGIDTSSVEQGSIAYFSGTGTWNTLAHGTAGQVLQTGGHGANPSWSAPASINFASSVVYNTDAPTTWTDLDLSSVVGSNTALVMLQITNNGSYDRVFTFRTNGASTPSTISNSYYGGHMAFPKLGESTWVFVKTDTGGVIEWASTASAVSTTITVLAYWK